MTVLEKADGVDWLMDLDSGHTSYPLAGVGHSAADLFETIRQSEDPRVGMWIEITEGKWGWSPRFKWCSNYDTGWGCDNEGEWHRHYSLGYGSVPSTMVTCHFQKPIKPFGKVLFMLPLLQGDPIE